MSKIIAIDFGLKRTGLAISDESRMFAFGLETVPSHELMQRLIALVADESVDTIVIGLPKRMNNEEAHITQNVLLLEEALKKQFPLNKIVLMDERFTSKMASAAMHSAGATKKQKREKGLRDKVSATIILQSFLESQNPY